MKTRGGGRKHLQLLGLSPSNEYSKEEINAAYRKASLKNHPDKNKDNPNASENQTKINSAKTHIFDTMERNRTKKYRASRSPPQRPSQSGFPQTQSQSGFPQGFSYQDAESARRAAENARRAERDAENARRAAERDAKNARRDAENARRDAENARRAAERDAANARRAAERDAANARRAERDAAHSEEQAAEKSAYVEHVREMVIALNPVTAPILLNVLINDAVRRAAAEYPSKHSFIDMEEQYKKYIESRERQYDFYTQQQERQTYQNSIREAARLQEMAREQALEGERAARVAAATQAYHEYASQHNMNGNSLDAQLNRLTAESIYTSIAKTPVSSPVSSSSDSSGSRGRRRRKTQKKR